jgi:hypothetical protein
VLVCFGGVRVGLGVSEGCGLGLGGSDLFLFRQTPNAPQTNAKTSGCEAGKYSGAEGATSESTCIECGAGTYSAATAATAESTCQGENQLATITTAENLICHQILLLIPLFKPLK